MHNEPIAADEIEAAPPHFAAAVSTVALAERIDAAPTTLHWHRCCESDLPVELDCWADSIDVLTVPACPECGEVPTEDAVVEGYRRECAEEAAGLGLHADWRAR